MLHERLSAYLDLVEQAVQQSVNVYVERYEEEILTPTRVNLRIRLRFNPGHLLEMNEAIIVTDSELNFLDYRYHFQDEQNYLVFRYDSTPHFPDLPDFPYHKHLPDKVISSPKPNLFQVLQEISQVIAQD
ncbi:DUF6516 family protein [Roseofilum sp. BLCC_M154]|uniref:DUF6516 family protein n=1 Tax=Roseofilum acuticapitatum BLCC-M154 TaxID=3022444 RepID=A0ABT7ATQ4_9CYAN|nr:DUF6516 family protein [Roseofilum acuticapitatum]MDJ1170291.1 DUF6516 family protein [Roseofilum acuticapitatum BLCC-M154]